jgi:mannosyltransferase OCH1-like enzyme
MWNYKPTEKKMFPENIINHNLSYIKLYEIITPNEMKEFINNDTFPELLELYNKIPHWVTKSDLSRLLLIYFKGDIYSDADCFIQKNLDIHNNNHNLFLFTENICKSVNELGPRECKNPENVLRIANYFFGSKTIKHPFLKEVVEECLKRLNQLLIFEKKTTIDTSDILWCCGPDVITTIYHKSKHNYNDIYLYDKTFLQHKCDGSWRN